MVPVRDRCGRRYAGAHALSRRDRIRRCHEIYRQLATADSGGHWPGVELRAIRIDAGASIGGICCTAAGSSPLGRRRCTTTWCSILDALLSADPITPLAGRDPLDQRYARREKSVLATTTCATRRPCSVVVLVRWRRTPTACSALHPCRAARERLLSRRNGRRLARGSAVDPGAHRSAPDRRPGPTRRIVGWSRAWTVPCGRAAAFVRRVAAAPLARLCQSAPRHPQLPGTDQSRQSVPFRLRKTPRRTSATGVP